MFFLVMFILYGLGSTYLLIRGWQALEGISWARPYFVVLLVILSSSFFIARFLRGSVPEYLPRFLQDVGMSWMVPMLYFVLFLLVLDLARIIDHFFPFLPSWNEIPYPKIKLWVLGLGVVLVLGVSFYGYLRFIRPEVRTLTITLPKTERGLDSLRLVLASDLHLGTTTHKDRLSRYVDLINRQNPDLVCLAGDIIDTDLTSADAGEMALEFRRIKTQWGVFSVPGNHDHYANIQEAIRFFESANINLLMDSAVNVAETIQLMGREDRSRRQRKSLAEIRKDFPATLPVVLLDHQPIGLEEAAENGIGLQLSGHTHDGQIWPFRALVRSMYEISHGYLRKGDTRYYVSSGLALWGPPYRIGTTSELVTIRLLFRE